MSTTNQNGGSMKFFTFYLERPDEEGELGVYPTAEAAMKAAEEGCFTRFSIAEMTLDNVTKYKSAYIPADE